MRGYPSGHVSHHRKIKQLRKSLKKLSIAGWPFSIKPNINVMQSLFNLLVTLNQPNMI